MQPKVFCIGFHKTGTSTMGEVLRTLGYSWYNYRLNPAMVTQLSQSPPDYSLAQLATSVYDAFEDDPWPYLFRELDKWHPGSKFILTLREPAQWLHSVVNYFTNRDSVWRTHVYGHSVPQESPDEYLSIYNQHTRAVLAYFKDRPGDLLVIDITKEPSWDKVCHFLGKSVPQVAFPHLNKTVL